MPCASCQAICAGPGAIGGRAPAPGRRVRPGPTRNPWLVLRGLSRVRLEELAGDGAGREPDWEDVRRLTATWT